MMDATKLIQELGFREAFDAALEQGDYALAREVSKTERRLFGYYGGYMRPTSQFPICSNPLRSDMYNHCSYNCQYCFASHRSDELLVPASISSIRDGLSDIFSGKKLTGAMNSFATMVRAGWPIHIGGMTDPMPPIELKKRVFYAMLEELLTYDCPYIVSTKSVVPLKDHSYIDMLADMKDRVIFQMSLISRENSRFLEPNVPSAELRIKVLQELCVRGVNCIVRLQPMFPQLVDEQRELFQTYADIGVKGVTVEGLKVKRALRVNKIKLAVFRQFGVELDNLLSSRRYSKKIYSTGVKIKYHKALRDMAHDCGLLYYVADNNLRHMGDSPNCCGTDLIGAKTNWYNITNLSYRNPDDFGFHLIREQDNDYLRLPVSYSTFKVLGDDIGQTLEHIYNDKEWMYDTYQFMYIDKNGDKHYRLKDVP